MNRKEKEKVISDLTSSLDQSELLVVMHQKGLDAGETSSLRSEMKKADVTCRVAKNTLFALAVKDTKYDAISKYLSGPTLFAYSNDPIAAAKVSIDFSKKNDKIDVLCGVLKGNFLDANQVKSLASLPSLEELRANIVGVIQAPATKIAKIMAEPAAQITRVVFAKSTQ